MSKNSGEYSATLPPLGQIAALTTRTTSQGVRLERVEREVEGIGAKLDDLRAQQIPALRHEIASARHEAEEQWAKVRASLWLLGGVWTVLATIAGFAIAAYR